MGRKKDDVVWNMFEKTSNVVTCKYCGKTSRFANVSRMRSHILKCSRCPSDLKQSVSSARSALVGNQILSPLHETPSTSINQAISLSECTNIDKKKIDKLIALATVVSGAPIRMLEHPLWKKVFEALDPMYTLPTRKTITSYIDKTYQEMKNTHNTEINTFDILHLQLDCWTNVRNEGIIHFLISAPDPLLAEFINTLDNRHTAGYLTSKIHEIMDSIGPEKIFVLIGDNAPNIQRAFLDIKEFYPHVTPLRCIAHTLNLLVNDILKNDVIKGFFGMVITMIKEIKYSQVLSALFVKISKEKNCCRQLKLPIKTRWSSSFETLDVLKIVKPALQTLAVHENARISIETKATILDESFWIMVNEVAAIIGPINSMLKKIEGNGCLMQKVIPAWRQLISKMTDVMNLICILSEREKLQIMNNVMARKNATILPIHMAACLLDPTQCGNNLNTQEDTAAMEFISNISMYLETDNVMIDLANFKSKQEFWSRSFVWSSINNVSPLSWWVGICKNTNLSKVAKVVFTAPVTSAACERSFSTLSGIHTYKRNKLLTERAGRMAFISYNWTIKNKENLNRITINNIAEDVDMELDPLFLDVDFSNDESTVHDDSSSSDDD